MRQLVPPNKKAAGKGGFFIAENLSQGIDMNQPENSNTPSTPYIVEAGLVTLIGTLPATASRRAALVCLNKEGK